MSRLPGSVVLIALIATAAFGVTPSSSSQGQRAPVSKSQRSKQRKWVASWTASMHGPYPSGNPSAQPVLDFAFESTEQGAVDQTMRLIVKPDLWGRVIRLHFANTFGTISGSSFCPTD